MDLIDVERFFAAVAAVLHPFGVFEFIFGHVTDDGSTVRTKLHAESIRVAVIDRIVVAVIDTVFVHLSRLCLWDIAFPEVAVINFVHL